MKFGRCLTDLYEDLTTCRACPPALPAVVPPARESFQALPEEGFDLGYAQLKDVYNYVRRGKHLNIPNEWRGLLPRPGP